MRKRQKPSLKAAWSVGIPSNTKPVKRAVKAVILDPDGLVLVLRRSDTHPHIPLTMDIPGGTIDDDEDKLTTLVREIKEEVGIDASDKTITSVGADSFEVDGRQIELEMYEISGFSTRPDVTLSFEHDKFDWIPLTELTHVGYFDRLVDMYVAKHRTN